MLKKLLYLFLTCSPFLGANESLYSAPNVTYFNGQNFELNGESKSETSKIQSFNLDQYQIYHVPGLGSFYIDYLHDTIKKTLSEGHPWEPHIADLIKKYTRKDSIAIDIGSHIGTHLITMSKAVGDHGIAIGFEPQMKIFSELTKNMELNMCSNVIAYRSAVGRDFGQVQMQSAYTSNEGGTKIGRGGDFAPLIPLDFFDLDNVSLIKIDVEEYEQEVLAGARKTILKNHPFIIIEMADGNKTWDAKRDVTIKILEDMGYNLKKLGGWDWIATPNCHP